MAAAAQSRPEAHVRLCAFFERHAGKVRHLLGTAAPGLVFASGVAYAKAIAAAVPAEVPEILTESLTAAAAPACRRVVTCAPSAACCLTRKQQGDRPPVIGTHGRT